MLEMLTCKVGHGEIKERRLKESGWLDLEFARSRFAAGGSILCSYENRSRASIRNAMNGDPLHCET